MTTQTPRNYYTPPDGYYTAPTDEVFNDVKAGCMSLWRTCDDSHGYATEKVNRIKDITNISDNCLSMVAMFDVYNIQRLLPIITSESRGWLEPFVEHELARALFF